MAQLLGADVAELRELASSFDASAQQLAGAATVITTRLLQTSWEGPDCQQFIFDWQSRLRLTLVTTGTRLHEAAVLLNTNATEQETASDASGGGSTPVPQTKPDKDPDPDGVGDYEDIDNDIPLDDTSLTPFNIIQGSLGDCWFLTGAGSLVWFDADFIAEHIKENPDGTWTVTFYKDGEPVEITVSPTVPGDAAEGKDGEPDWISIYEKAGAIYMGGAYDDLDLDTVNQAYEMMTGKDATYHGEINLSEIRDLLKDGPVAVSTEAAEKDTFWFWEDHVDDSTIVPGHAYMVLEVADHKNPDTGDTEQMIRVLNPWGPGGSLDGEEKAAELWLTEKEYRENFRGATSVNMG